MSDNTTTITTTKVFATELGYVGIATRGDAVLRTTLPEPTAELARSALDAPATSDAPDGGANGQPVEEDSFADWVAGRIAGYFRNACADDLSDIRVDQGSTTEFTRRAREACRSIPRGEVRTYRWLASQAGNPNASRAAGRAMATNPVPLLIPCHRVVGSDGSYTGFGGSIGVPLKERLLTLERNGAE